MSRVNYQQMHELRAIVYDHTAPLANRMAAQTRYDKLLDETAIDFDVFLEKIREEINEPGKPS